MSPTKDVQKINFIESYKLVWKLILKNTTFKTIKIWLISLILFVVISIFFRKEGTYSTISSPEQVEKTLNMYGDGFGSLYLWFIEGFSIEYFNLGVLAIIEILILSLFTIIFIGQYPKYVFIRNNKNFIAQKYNIFNHKDSKTFFKEFITVYYSNILMFAIIEIIILYNYKSELLNTETIFVNVFLLVFLIPIISFGLYCIYDAFTQKPTKK